MTQTSWRLPDATCGGDGNHRVAVASALVHLRRALIIRPAEVEDRAVSGHWEGDLIMGKRMRAIGTLVERSTRCVMLFRLPDGNGAPAVRKALTKRIVTLPTELRRSLTWDQGREMAEHVRFTVDIDVRVYVCDPKSPWQRGSNENINGLLRQYFPKGDRSLGAHPDTPQRRGPRAQRTASTHPRWSDTIRGASRGCWVDRLTTDNDPSAA